jgi:hypothetical protein
MQPTMPAGLIVEASLGLGFYHPQPFLLPLFTEVPGRGVLGRSHATRAAGIMQMRGKLERGAERDDHLPDQDTTGHRRI